MLDSVQQMLDSVQQMLDYIQEMLGSVQEMLDCIQRMLDCIQEMLGSVQQVLVFIQEMLGNARQMTPLPCTVDSVLCEQRQEDEGLTPTRLPRASQTCRWEPGARLPAEASAARRLSPTSPSSR